MGNYSVKSDFSYLKVSAEDVQFPSNIYQPDAIIDKCQSHIKMLLTQFESNVNPESLEQVPASSNRLDLRTEVGTLGC